MASEFTPAKPISMKVKGAFAGTTGSGKTFSALRVATGMIGKTGKIAFIDTERGRGGLYAKHFKYDIAQLTPPFTPERYTEMIDRAAKHAGPNGVVIVDSGSHVWEGEGGVKDEAEQTAIKMAARYKSDPEKFTALGYNGPKQRHWKFMSHLIDLNCHVIVCLRAKEKIKFVKDGGATKIISAGVLPIAEKDFGFEMLFLGVMAVDNPGVPVWSAKALMTGLEGVFPKGKQVDEDTGKRLVSWASGGEDDMAKRWVDKTGEPIGEDHVTIREALKWFEELWNENHDYVTHIRNAEIMEEYEPKIPSKEIKKIALDYAEAIRTAIAKEYHAAKAVAETET